IVGCLLGWLAKSLAGAGEATLAPAGVAAAKVGFAPAAPPPPPPARGEGAAARRKYEPASAGVKPLNLMAGPDGQGDDLAKIRSVSPERAGRLHGLGVWHFSQIAAWTPANAGWIAHRLGEPGRVEGEDWIGQAKALIGGAAAAPAPAAAPAAEPAR